MDELRSYQNKFKGEVDRNLFDENSASMVALKVVVTIFIKEELEISMVKF